MSAAPITGLEQSAQPNILIVQFSNRDMSVLSAILTQANQNLADALATCQQLTRDKISLEVTTKQQNVILAAAMKYASETGVLNEGLIQENASLGQALADEKKMRAALEEKLAAHEKAFGPT